MRRGALALLVLALSGCGSCRTPGGRDFGAGTFSGPLAAREVEAVFEGKGTGETRIEAPEGAPVLVVPKGAHVTLRDLTLVGGGEHTVIVRGGLQAVRVRVEGGRAAFRIEAGGRAELHHVEVVGAESAVHVSDGRADVEDLNAEDLSRAALFVAKGTLEGEGIAIRRAEYGLLATVDGQFALTGLDVSKVRYASVGTTGAGGRIGKARLSGGRHGGIVANDLTAPLVLDDVVVEDVRGSGVQVIRGSLSAGEVRISKVAADAAGDLGSGFLLDTVDATLWQISVRDVAGEGLAVLGGRTRVTNLRIAGTGAAGVQAGRRARVELEDAVIDGTEGPALSAAEGARIRVDTGRLEGEPPVADCGSRARIVVAKGVRVAGEPVGCVRRR